MALAKSVGASFLLGLGVGFFAGRATSNLGSATAGSPPASSLAAAFDGACAASAPGCAAYPRLRLVIASHVKYGRPLSFLLESLLRARFRDGLRDAVVVFGGSGADTEPYTASDRWGQLGVTYVNTTVDSWGAQAHGALFHNVDHPRVKAHAYMYIQDTSLAGDSFAANFERQASLIGDDEIRLFPEPHSFMYAFGHKVVRKYGTQFDRNMTKQEAVWFEHAVEAWMDKVKMRPLAKFAEKVTVLPDREHRGEADLYDTKVKRQVLWYPEFGITKFILLDKLGDISGAGVEEIFPPPPLRLVIHSHASVPRPLGYLLGSLLKLKEANPGFALNTTLVVIAGASADSLPHQPVPKSKDAEWGQASVVFIRSTLSLPPVAALSALFHHADDVRVRAGAYLCIPDTVLLDTDFASRFEALASAIGDNEVWIPEAPSRFIFAFGRAVVGRYGTSFDLNMSKSEWEDLEHGRGPIAAKAEHLTAFAGSVARLAARQVGGSDHPYYTRGAWSTFWYPDLALHKFVKERGAPPAPPAGS